jgi:hypothetical protein
VLVVAQGLEDCIDAVSWETKNGVYPEWHCRLRRKDLRRDAIL